ncbi:MAG: TIGR03618 family F420-dependent PPOX class oxidoreductase [Chloroflexi bacterium]|nr:TIGR03618 family F420-dependent PPOX class oxidoreductase [Chloroflexota bacterium]MCC6895353.1 TIGR03618 family F420-dependent PPOX class oxidoreductase [Anaerolineae bacterium]
MAVPIPEKFKDLLDRPIVVSLVTLMPDGKPQATPVWVDVKDGFVRVNSARGRQKDKNMKVGSSVTVLSIDPENPYRWMEVRGEVVEETEEGAVDHINVLSAKYMNRPDYYAGNEAQRGKEQRVTYKIEVQHVNTSR